LPMEMEDSSLFMQWAMNTLHQEQPVPAVDDERGKATFPSLQALREASHAAEMIQELIAESHPTNSWSSGDGDTTDGINSLALAPTVMEHDISARRVPSRSGAGSNPPAVSWNFSAASAKSGSDGMLALAETAATRGMPDLVSGSPPARKAGGGKSPKPMASPYGPQDHIIAERKRREKINQRFIELSTVIPGLKKMDKATILSDATRYVKKLQEKLKDMEVGGSNGRSIETVVVVKRPCRHTAATAEEDGSPASPGKKLPEIEARFSEKSVMVRIHCENGKAVAAKVLTEIEELHLGIIHANVMPFSASTLIITITAEARRFSPPI
ncbi:hypothetical protein EJB05_42245, partial [Eragrostis curvula]